MLCLCRSITQRSGGKKEKMIGCSHSFCCILFSFYILVPMVTLESMPSSKLLSKENVPPTNPLLFHPCVFYKKAYCYLNNIRMIYHHCSTEKQNTCPWYPLSYKTTTTTTFFFFLPPTHIMLAQIKLKNYNKQNA